MADAPGWLAAANRLAHRDILSSLEQKVAPEHTALVVVDVQNDFCAPGGMMDHEGLDLSFVQAMASRIPSLIDAARIAGTLVVFIRNVYSTDANVYLSDSWLEQASRRRQGSYTERDVCAAGSWEGDFYGDVRPQPGEPVVTKHRFSAFHNTDLETILRSHAIRTVVMTGVASNVCVETTARDAFVRDFYVVFLDDGTATYAEEDHQATLRVIDRFFGEVTSVAAVERIWQGDVEQPGRNAASREPARSA
jgi:ureidoacrylate peracid hydrolase